MVIQTNARDNSGLAPVLGVQVSSSEPPEVDGSGNTIPDVLITGVDQTAGLVYLQLRAERAGAGAGRVYTVTITATNASGNSSTASVQIIGPARQEGCQVAQRVCVKGTLTGLSGKGL